MNELIAFLALLFKELNAWPMIAAFVVGSHLLLKKDISHLKELLNNHITDTTKEIKRLADGQAKLEKKIEDLQARLAAKLDKVIDRFLDKK